MDKIPFFLMENDSLKSTHIGKMPEYKPVSTQQYTQYRDYLLSLLFKDESVTENPCMERDAILITPEP